MSESAPVRRSRRSAGTAADAHLLAADGAAAALERAAAAIGRLDALLHGHPLTVAWVWRTRLDAVRRQAAADGRAIDPWQLAAVVEGVRFRLPNSGSLADRGAVFDAARHALGLWRWFVHPDTEQGKAIAAAAAALPAEGSALLGAARAVHAWLDAGGARPPLRAALAQHWQRRGLLPVPVPLLTGARALHAEVPWAIEPWAERFLAAVAEEAASGLALLRRMESGWSAARGAVTDRRRDSHAAAVIDVLAAAPLVSATSLATGLGISVKTTSALLDELVGRGIAIEVTRRAKRRLYGLVQLAPLRAETAAPRRPVPGRGRGRPRHDAREPMDDGEGEAAELGPPAALPPVSPLQRRAFDYGELDHWMREAELAIRRTKALLDDRAGAPAASPPAGARPEVAVPPTADDGEELDDDGDEPGD